MKQSITFDDLPKYLTYYRGKVNFDFRPVIVKWEHENCDNSFYAMYAKYNAHSSTLNLSKVLFWVSGKNYQETEKAFLNKYCEMSKYIKGKAWTGNAPQKLNLMEGELD